MSDASQTISVAPKPPPRSRPYVRLLWLVPSLAMLAVGLYFHKNVPDGGAIESIKLSTKPGVVGQAAEAVANMVPTTPDLYLILGTSAGTITLPTFKDTVIGNGLTWNLSMAYQLGDIQRVEVWDHHTLWKDKPLDRITMSGWETDGQLFHIDLQGKPNQPPKWALPLAAVGSALTLLVVLRFVWDQVI